MKAKISLLQRNSILFLLLGIFAASCVGSYIDVTATPQPTSTIVPTETLTVTPSATATETPLPTATATGTATQTLAEVTPLGGIPFAVTPRPKVERISGWYTPYSLRNVRWGPSIDSAERYKLAAGNTKRVYAWASNLPVEMWVCLDEPIGNDYLCHEAVAAVWDWEETGEFIIDE